MQQYNNKFLPSLIYVLILMMGLTSCQNNNKNKDKIKKEISEYQNKQMALPFIPNSPSDKGYTIATHIDGDCKACVEELIQWEKWIEKDSSHVRFALYLHATDPSRIKHIDTTYWTISYPLIPDTTQKYLKENDLDEHDKLFQTFLLDNKGKVLLAGNPLQNDELTRLYRQIIYQEK